MTDDAPAHSAGISAVLNAERGDWTALRGRLCDPAVTLTMFEREWLARKGPGKGGRRPEAQEPLLYWWFRNAEGLDRDGAVKAVCKALGKRDAKDAAAVAKALQRAGWDAFDPGEIWHRNARMHRDGSGHPTIFPPAIRRDAPDFMEFLRSRTE